MSADTSEKGLETLIVRHMTGVDGLAPPPADRVAESPPHFGTPPPQRGNGWLIGWASDWRALQVFQLLFVRADRWVPWFDPGRSGVRLPGGASRRGYFSLASTTGSILVRPAALPSASACSFDCLST
jgi:hypothetical protein